MYSRKSLYSFILFQTTERRKLLGYSNLNSNCCWLLRTGLVTDNRPGHRTGSAWTPDSSMNGWPHRNIKVSHCITHTSLPILCLSSYLSASHSNCSRGYSEFFCIVIHWLRWLYFVKLFTIRFPSHGWRTLRKTVFCLDAFFILKNNVIIKSELVFLIFS